MSRRIIQKIDQEKPVGNASPAEIAILTLHEFYCDRAINLTQESIDFLGIKNTSLLGEFALTSAAAFFLYFLSNPACLHFTALNSCVGSAPKTIITCIEGGIPPGRYKTPPSACMPTPSKTRGFKERRRQNENFFWKALNEIAISCFAF